MPQYPKNELLDNQVQAWDDPKFRQRLYDSAPGFQLGGIKFGGTQLSEADDKLAKQAGIDTYKIQNPGWLNFGGWDALNEIKPKESQIRSQLPMVQAVENRQAQLQQFQIDRQQDLQRDQAQMQFDFGSKMADKNLQGAKELAEQQGKLNLRQTMFNSATNRQGSRMWN